MLFFVKKKNYTFAHNQQLVSAKTSLLDVLILHFQDTPHKTQGKTTVVVSHCCLKLYCQLYHLGIHSITFVDRPCHFPNKRFIRTTGHQCSVQTPVFNARAEHLMNFCCAFQSGLYYSNPHHSGYSWL